LSRTSGAHLNPAITLALALTRRHPYARVLPYILAQLAGGLAAAAVVRWASGDAGALLTRTSPNLLPVQAVAIEAIATMILAFVIMHAAAKRSPAGDVAGAPIGLAVLAGALFAGPFTGGSMNPARSIGPALIAADLSGLWLYLVGPALGAVLGALLYDIIHPRIPAAAPATLSPRDQPIMPTFDELP
jgi:MIP family channel proteins